MCMEQIADLMRMCDAGDTGSCHYKDLSECLVCHLGLKERFAESVVGYGMQVAKIEDQGKLRYRLFLASLEQCFRVRV